MFSSVQRMGWVMFRRERFCRARLLSDAGEGLFWSVGTARILERLRDGFVIARSVDGLFFVLIFAVVRVESAN